MKPQTTPACRLPMSRHVDQAADDVANWQKEATAIMAAATTRSPVLATTSIASALVVNPSTPMPHRASFRFPVRRARASVAQPPSSEPAPPEIHGSDENRPA